MVDLPDLPHPLLNAKCKMKLLPFNDNRKLTEHDVRGIGEVEDVIKGPHTNEILLKRDRITVQKIYEMESSLAASSDTHLYGENTDLFIDATTVSVGKITGIETKFRDIKAETDVVFSVPAASVALNISEVKNILEITENFPAEDVDVVRVDDKYIFESTEERLNFLIYEKLRNNLKVSKDKAVYSCNVIAVEDPGFLV